MADITGTAAGETLHGTPNADLLTGLAGDDALNGDLGDDTLDAGDGDDTLAGGAGADRLLGGTGADTAVYAASGAGVTVTLDGPAGAGGDAQGDLLSAVENLVGSSFADRLAGTHVANRLHGAGGADVIYGLGGNDALDGGEGNDTLDAGDGDDQLVGGAGADRLLGGAGVDAASYAGSAAGVAVTLDSAAQIGGDAAGDALFAVEWLIGSGSGDRLTGNHVSNRLYGGAGNDMLSGLDGNDLLDGGAGNDTLAGGAGSFDMVSYAASADAVTVNLTTGLGRAGSGEEDLLSGLENVTGSAFDDVLIGDGLLNQLDGGAGNDMLVGGAGADRLLGGAGVDTASYGASAAGVTVTLDGPAGSGGDAVGDLLYYIEYLVGSGSADRLTGNHVSNRLFGGAGDDSLTGAGGNDLLDGGGGSDLLDGGAGIDTVSYATATSRAFVNLQTSLATDPAFIEMDSLAGIENVIGSTLDDILVGEAGANRLEGGNGNDLLVGGLGGDQLFGSAGADLACYEDSSAGVTVFLDGRAGVGGEAAGDVLSGIERLLGSAYADRLVGDAAANIFQGGAGDDLLEGGGGNDLLYGGSGYDRVKAAASLDEAAIDGVEEVILSGFSTMVVGQRDLDLERITGEAGSSVQLYEFSGWTKSAAATGGYFQWTSADGYELWISEACSVGSAQV